MLETITAIGAVLATVKDIVTGYDAMGKAKLKLKLLEVVEQLSQLSDKLREQEAEIARLTEAATKKEEMTLRGNVYFDKAEVPHCSFCLDGEAKRAIKLSKLPVLMSDAGEYECPRCHNVF